MGGGALTRDPVEMLRLLPTARALATCMSVEGKDVNFDLNGLAPTEVSDGRLTVPAAALLPAGLRVTASGGRLEPGEVDWYPSAKKLPGVSETAPSGETTPPDVRFTFGGLSQRLRFESRDGTVRLDWTSRDGDVYETTGRWRAEQPSRWRISGFRALRDFALPGRIVLVVRGRQLDLYVGGVLAKNVRTL